ncbi:MAG: response regulator [Bdellovibrionales bacterium]|nr:response regulator [Bdellovibrionales bacterium]
MLFSSLQFGNDSLIESVFLTGSVLITFVAVTLLILLIRVRHDFDYLRYAFVNALHGKPLPKRGAFTMARAEHIWHLIKALALDRGGGAANNFDLVRAWKRSVAQATMFESASTLAQDLLGMIFREFEPDVVAVAWINSDGEGGSLQVEALCGAFKGRLEQVILEHVQRKLDFGSPNGANDRFIAAPVDDKGLNLFGISREVLFCPVDEAVVSNSLIWVGLRTTCSQLEGIRLEVLEAMTAHVCSLLLAAKAAEKRVSDESFDRDVILGISHDLKAPGNSAMYALDALLCVGRPLDEQERNTHLRIVDHAVREQHRMVCDLLDFARYRHGRLTSNRASFRLSTVVEEVVEREKILLTNRGVELSLRIPIDMTVLADELHLSRVLSNLLSNAIKYGGGGQILIEAVRAGDWVDLSVSDSGPGIASENLGELFKPFNRFSRSGGVQGTGLGLAVSKLLVEASGGSLSYTRSSLGGAMFAVRMKTGQLVVESKWRSSGIKALVLDDDGAARRAMIRQLGSLVDEVFEAENVEQARRSFAKAKPDLVISDVQLGDTSATDFLNELDSEVPVIVASGANLRGARGIFHERDKLAMLEKPFDKHALRNAVNRVLSDA